MERQKPATRTVAPRKVYGKRRNNATRAVFFDHQSPSRVSPLSSKDVNVRIEAIQTKLSKVTLNEVSASEPPDVHSNCTSTSISTSTSKVPKRSSTSKIKSPLKSPPSVHLPPPPSSLRQPPKNLTRQPVRTTAIETPKPIATMIDLSLNAPSAAPFALHVDEDEDPNITTGPTELNVAEVTAALASQFVPGTEANINIHPILNGDLSSTSIPATNAKVDDPECMSNVPTFIQDEKTNDYVRPILCLASSRYAAYKVQNFARWGSSNADMFTIVKLAEGSYGEVYQLQFREDRVNTVFSKSRLDRLRKLGTGILKVVPLRARTGMGSRSFTTIPEIVAELKMLKYLDPIPGFARFRAVDVVQGRLPEPFQDAWNNYKRLHAEDCWNANPASKKSYPDTQLWAIIEMENAGCELEKFGWTSIFQVYDIFWGVAMSLARAEEYAQFEHRDLHMGNICIRSRRADGSTKPPTFREIADWTMYGQTSKRMSPSGFGISGLETTIIDYTLSRAVIRDDPNDPEGSFEVASTDLDKKQLFDSTGEDEGEVLLRDTYRFMRAALYHGQPSQTEKTADIPGVWGEYSPRTNLVWLVFLLKSLLKNVVPGLSEEECEDLGKNFSPKVMRLEEEETSTVAQNFKERLDSVLCLLDFATGHEDICCAADLIAYAIDSKWLVAQDFF
ncbi:hypothetical protein N7495_004510 [Penicillium taxi]|uniref:uncharacterized protein n=1 Tax=Penicillium taxi TaxID=168475 RepID=UPI0025452738|nr:uncharacterized protein N7495_004510 [Penicillium taxi]KAJ5899766.1 hypothetical protein N7495_004510 [Penicillium taxi]